MSKTKPISGEIRRALAECGKSRYRVAQETGIAESVLSRFVHGKAGVSLATLDRLAEAIGVQVVVVKPKQGSK